MSILVIAEHDQHTLKEATAKALSAAKQLGGDIHVLVAGQGCAAVAQQAAGLEGVSKVWLCEAAHYLEASAENLAQLVVSQAADYSHLLAGASTFGKNLMPRVAAMLDAAQFSDITAVIDANTFVRPIYAGAGVATVSSNEPVKVLTVRPSAFASAASGSGSAAVETLAAVPAHARAAKLVKREITQSARPELDAAKVVVSGGRGLGSAEAFAKLLEPLADKLGAALGASRAAVDAGYVPNDYQVGQTGKVVAPDLYIAVGISGAIQHLAGMKDSKVIVAINKDAEAPIFQLADYGLVGDLFEVLPQLTQAL